MKHFLFACRFFFSLRWFSVSSSLAVEDSRSIYKFWMLCTGICSMVRHFKNQKDEFPKCLDSFSDFISFSFRPFHFDELLICWNFIAMKIDIKIKGPNESKVYSMCYSNCIEQKMPVKSSTKNNPKMIFPKTKSQCLRLYRIVFHSMK